MTDIKMQDFGYASVFECGKSYATIIEGAGEISRINDRVDSLKDQVKQAESAFEAEKIQERITRLASGVAVIRVGGSSEVEVMEKKHRIEDALEAVRSAQSEGILPGGGVSFYRLSKACVSSLEGVLTPDEHACLEIVQRALQAPLRALCRNSFVEYEMVVKEIDSQDSPSYGFNFLTAEFEDLKSNGILDPAKVVRCSIKNALSVVSTLITTEFAIVEV
jgi:chaperonin GroEL